MKRTPQSLTRYFGPVILYRDDIEQIIKVMKSVTEKVEISGEGYTFETEQEWVDLKFDQLTSFQVRSSGKSYLSFVLSKSDVYLFLGDDLPEGRGAFEQIKTIVRHCGRRPQFLYSFGGSFSISVFGLLGCVAILTQVLTKNSALLPPFAVAVALSGVWSTWWTYLSKFRNGIVIPKYRRDVPNFWTRNADKIALAVISCLIGAAVSWLFSQCNSKRANSSVVQSPIQSVGSNTNSSTNAANPKPASITNTQPAKTP